jgi:hypothetical protein
MSRTIKQALIGVVFLGSAALVASPPASANSIHDEGYFGGGYTAIGPGPYYVRRGAGRIGPLHEGRGYAYGPPYGAYAYEPSYEAYAYGPVYYPHYAYSPYDYGPDIAPGY